MNAAVTALKERGFESPYLKAFVVARINPLRFQRKPTADFDETIDKMIGGARSSIAGKISADQVARYRRGALGGVIIERPRRATEQCD